MPFLFFFPMIVAAGLVEAAADDMVQMQRAWLGHPQQDAQPDQH